MRFVRKPSFPHSHGKASDDLVSLGTGERVEESVVGEADGVEVEAEAFPRPRSVVVCASRNCSFTGSFSSDEVSHELISLGSCTI